MATHSSILAWRVPGTGEPGGLPSMGSHRIRHDWSNLAAAAAVRLPQLHSPHCNSIKCTRQLGYRVSLSKAQIASTTVNYKGLLLTPTSKIIPAHRLWTLTQTPRSQTKRKLISLFSAVQSHSRVQLFATPWIAACQASLYISNSRSSLRLTSIESVMPSSHLILCRPLLLLPPIPPSIRVFSTESTLLMRWPKYWSFSFSIIPSKEIPGLISFRMHWLDLLAVQGTLNSLLQHHSSKASVLQCSAFFMVQFSHPCMTTGKIIALTRWTFVNKVNISTF